MDDQHYMCTGECGGVSAVPGMCQAESCTMHHQPLVPCDCNSLDHLDQLSTNDDEE